ncbi:MAG: family 78 glycoside hydrolase catalytic domain [Planctomycetota bacterium]
MFTRARWICDPDFVALTPRPLLRLAYQPELAAPHQVDLVNRHTFYRAVVNLDHQPGSARLRLTADDWYRLWINGRLVGEGPAPGYHYRYFVNDWDVSSFLRTGTNVVAVHVYYQGLVNRVWNSGDYRQGLIAELESDNTVVLASNGQWRQRICPAYAALATIGYQTQIMERFDNRHALRGWNATGYDDADWNLASEHPTHDYTFVPQPTPTLSRYPVIPMQLEQRADGIVFVDFGREIVGGVSMRGRGPAGATVEVRCGEELHSNGAVRYAMRCNCTYREEWILSGRDDDELDQVDYKAFRYLEVVVPPGAEIDLASIRVIARHYPLADDRWAWSSDVPALDAIVALCVNTLRQGAQDSILDCPTREKGQYLGDLTISGQAHLYVSGDLRLTRKCLEDFAASAAFAPGLMAVAPGSFMQEIADFSLQWPGQILRYWRHSGDVEGCRALLTTAEGMLHYFARYRRSDGLIADVVDTWNLVDWPDNARDGYDFPLTNPPTPGMHAVINAFYIRALTDFADLARELGRPSVVYPAPVAAAFRAAFYRPASQLFVDTATSEHQSLHTNVLALYAGIAPPESIPAIVALIRSKGLACGVYMAYFVLKALARAGAHDLIWDLVLGDGPHSWRNMLREGATACFEAWGKDQKWNTSLCHPWACAPIPVLIEDLVGLSPAQPGWKTIRFAPRIPQQLGAFTLRLTVASGEVLVEHGPTGTKLCAPAGVEVESA